MDNGEIMTADYYDISYRIIYAFDKDPLRYETLLKMIEASSASCVVSMCQDFLKVLNSMSYIGYYEKMHLMYYALSEFTCISGTIAAMKLRLGMNSILPSPCYMYIRYELHARHGRGERVH